MNQTIMWLVHLVVHIGNNHIAVPVQAYSTQTSNAPNVSFEQWRPMTTTFKGENILFAEAHSLDYGFYPQPMIDHLQYNVDGLGLVLGFRWEENFSYF